MTEPIVSVIVPTTHDRKEYNERILNNFIRQDYQQKHLMFDFNSGTIGEKRNRLCKSAIGEIIIHMDSDDWYSDNWITKSVFDLQISKADIIGMTKFYLYDPVLDAAWMYTYHPAGSPWVTGATMCYRKEFWDANNFPPLQIGEDAGFCCKTKNIVAHNYAEGFIATIHSANTSKKLLHNEANYRRCTDAEEIEIRKRYFRK